MPKKTREEIENQASQTFFKYYMKSPKVIRNMSKPLVKTAIRTSRRLKPYTDKSILQANVWIDTNIKGNKAVKIASNIKNAYIPNKNKK